MKTRNTIQNELLIGILNCGFLDVKDFTSSIDCCVNTQVTIKGTKQYLCNEDLINDIFESYDNYYCDVLKIDLNNYIYCLFDIIRANLINFYPELKRNNFSLYCNCADSRLNLKIVGPDQLTENEIKEIKTLLFDLGLNSD